VTAVPVSTCSRRPRLEMNFIFTMRSVSVDSMARQNFASNSSLPVISEDDGAFTSTEPPPIPPRARNRPSHSHFGLSSPPRLNIEGGLPEYSHPDSFGAEGLNGEKLADVRKGVMNNKRVVKRGGWKRLALMVLIATLCIVGLVVGLVIGLTKRDHSSSS